MKSLAGENFVENVEAVGNCKYAGWMPTAKNGELTHMHMMTYYDKTTRLRNTSFLEMARTSARKIPSIGNQTPIGTSMCTM